MHPVSSYDLLSHIRSNLHSYCTTLKLGYQFKQWREKRVIYLVSRVELHQKGVKVVWVCWIDDGGLSPSRELWYFPCGIGWFRPCPWWLLRLLHAAQVIKTQGEGLNRSDESVYHVLVLSLLNVPYSWRCQTS